MKFRPTAIAVLSIAVTVAGTAVAFAAGASHRINPSQAQSAALKKVAGKVVSTQYEREDGRWQYAVLVRNKKGLYEVEVDSRTGRVTDTEKTSMAEERAEAAADKANAERAHHARPAH